MKKKKDPKEIFKKFLHIGVVVRDLERTLNILTNVLGIGPVSYTHLTLPTILLV